MDSPRMETHTHAFYVRDTSAPKLTEQVNAWEGKGWTVRQMVVRNNFEWVVVFERPRET